MKKVIDKDREKNLQFIKNFSKITITKVCDTVGATRQNVISGKASSEKIRNVKEEIESEIAKLYLKKEK